MPTASDFQITSSIYKMKLATVWTDDLSGKTPETPRQTKIRQAMSILLDPEEKRKYDMTPDIQASRERYRERDAKRLAMIQPFALRDLPNEVIDMILSYIFTPRYAKFFTFVEAIWVDPVLLKASYNLHYSETEFGLTATPGFFPGDGRIEDVDRKSLASMKRIKLFMSSHNLSVSREVPAMT